MDNVKRLSDIEAKPVVRCLTGFEELDYIYGYSTFPTYIQWGMPLGKISLWSGSSGIGKSRLCIEVAKKWSKIYYNAKILYFQTESTLEDFASWTSNTADYPNIYCSGENKIDEMIKIIHEVKPYLIFIDSVNEIEEFENGNKHESRRLISGIDGKQGLKAAVNSVNAHLVLLGQLNQDGKTIKGGTSLPHLVDTALEIVPYHYSGSEWVDYFTVEVGVKHRYGKKGTFTDFCHNDDGVDNVSCYRLEDKTWCNSHKIQTLTEMTQNNVVPTTKKTGWYIGLDGQPTDIITPEMQAAMDKVGPIKLTKKEKAIVAQMRPFLHPDEPKLSMLDKLNRKVGDFFGLEP